MNTNANRWQYVVFSLILGLGLFLGLEVLSRIVHYQRHGTFPFALQGNVVALKNLWSEFEAERRVEHTIEELEELGLQADEERGLAPKEVRVKLMKALYSEQGQTLLNMFRNDYEETFATLVQETEKIQTKLLMLYIPQDNYKNSRLPNREFYRQVAAKYHVEYIDCTEEFLKYPVDWITLLPENGHLSRFGNHIVAEHVAPYLEKYSDYRSPHTFRHHPERFGDLKPHQDRIWNVMRIMPYRVITNSQGLRMEYDLMFPKQKQRILVLGDSYTFGPFLANHHCYPNILDSTYPDREIINAGIAGYTITDEVSLFQERAKYAEPDITILQVLENDIEGLFYFVKNQYDREGRTFTPSDKEKALIQHLSQQ
jgi:lysophospholipase L1-like esterase